jgi:hypothetical protein
MGLENAAGFPFRFSVELNFGKVASDIGELAIWLVSVGMNTC